MTERILLKPIEMTQDRIQSLEERGLVIRLCPAHHALPAPRGVTLSVAFGTHPGSEESLLIGDPETKPLYLVIPLQRKRELERRIAEHLLTAYDFVCPRVKYNDAQVSLFTMLAD